MDKKTDELLSTFTHVGDSSRRLVEKIFRERMQRKMMGATARVETAAPSGALGSGPAPRDGVHRPVSSTDGIGGDAAIRGFTASDGVVDRGDGAANHPPCGVHSREAGEAEAPPAVSRINRGKEAEPGERVEGKRKG